ncbi:MAG: hypothetical protein JNK32_11790 [Anaerolineales bacterium]|nr:hypothetical protein [Anaerolineales bacterium]
MKKLLSKIMMAFLAVTLVFAAIPVTQASAADEPPPVDELTTEQLEKVWARQLRIFERIGKAFEDPAAHIEKIQSRIDKAAEKGKDVSALQSALDAYEDALLASKPAYDSLGEVIDAHKGFDADGKVTDEEQARATVKEVREGMQAVKDSMGGTFKALREALKAFREANKPADASEKK